MITDETLQEVKDLIYMAERMLARSGRLDAYMTKRVIKILGDLIRANK